MHITKLSKDRMRGAAAQWSVPAEYFDPLYNYLVHGFEPGSFWTAALANDFARAIQHSHPANSIQALKNTVGWIQDQWPTLSYGNLQVVHHWLELTGAERRLHLEEAHLIYSEQDEIMMTLRGERSYEPYLD
jgi:hypothetical protein